MCLDTIFTADLFKAFPQSLGVRDDNVSNIRVFPWGPSFCIFTGAVGALYWVAFLDVVIVAIVLSVAVKILILNPMYDPPLVFALAQSLP